MSITYYASPPLPRADSSLIDIAAVSSKAELMAEYAASEVVPEYFGRNWDALYDVLSSTSPLMLVHRAWPRLSDEDAAVYAELLKDVAGLASGFEVFIPLADRSCVPTSLREKLVEAEGEVPSLHVMVSDDVAS